MSNGNPNKDSFVQIMAHKKGNNARFMSSPKQNVKRYYI